MSARSTLMSLRSIRQRLFYGFGMLVALFVAAGLVGRATIGTMSAVIGETLGDVQDNAQLSARLSASVSRELGAAQRYVELRDSLSHREVQEYGSDAHAALRTMNLQGGATTQGVALIARIDDRLSHVEIRFSLAHRLADLGRHGEADAVASAVRPEMDALQTDLQSLAQLKAREVTAASGRLRRDVDRRGAWMLIAIFAAVLLGLFVVYGTVTWISRPLRQLVAQARALSDGNFGVRTTGDLPGEFQELADAMNTAGESLARVVSVTSSTADDVANSARELANVSEQISASASQMASSMTEISSGAESQVRQLRSVDDGLRAIRSSAEDVLQGAGEVTALAAGIEETAQSKRTEIERALEILTTVRRTVGEAATEVEALDSTAADIDKFVATVSRIAEQTDLLALNAAIEAARAGAAGRGFAVVADEVRKLAEQAQAAAEDVVQLTKVVTTRVASTTRAMESGVTQVAEIEQVSHDIDSALTAIGGAAKRTREAAGSVAAQADRNVQIVGSAAKGVQSIAKTAEGHAAAAQQVSASTQEQSAACEQMSSASTQLLQGSEQLRELVGGLQAVA
ncbi:MAG: methyl-accepting chemotaxis protein [Gemmatimonadaceae bacterium]